MSPIPPDPGEPVFDAGERAEIVAEWHRQFAEPRPKSLRDYGCFVLVLTVALATAGSGILRAVGVTTSGTLAAVLAVGVGVLVVTGLGLWIFGDRGLRWAARRSHEAVTFFQAQGTAGTPGDRRRHAVALILNATCSSGPGTSEVYDASTVRTELGTALPYVMAVERVLRGEVGAWAVFTPGG